MKRFMTKEYLIRVVVVFLANCMAPFGLTFLRLSCLGTDPFSGLAYNLSEMTGKPLVVFMLGSHLLLFILMFSQMKEYIGIGMLINMTVYGVAADFWKSVILRVLPLRDDYSGMEALPLRIVLMVAGFLLLLFFISFYISSDTGMSPYDGFSYALEAKFPRFPFKIWRIIQDSSFLVLAFITGMIKGNPWSVIGAGTICMVLFTGPFITFFRERFADPLFDKIRGE